MNEHVRGKNNDKNCFINKNGGTEKRKRDEHVSSVVWNPHSSDSPMDDLWRALSCSVIGRHVGSWCGNESI